MSESPVQVRLEEMSRGDVEASLRAVLLMVPAARLDEIGPHIRDHIEQVAGLAALVRQVLAAQPDERDYGDADTLSLVAAPLADGKVRVTSRRFGEDSVTVLPHQELVVRASLSRRGQVNVARRNVRPRMPQDTVRVDGETATAVTAATFRAERDLARAALEIIFGWMLVTEVPDHMTRIAESALKGDPLPVGTGFEMAAPVLSFGEVRQALREGKTVSFDTEGRPSLKKAEPHDGTPMNLLVSHCGRPAEILADGTVSFLDQESPREGTPMDLIVRHSGAIDAVIDRQRGEMKSDIAAVEAALLRGDNVHIKPDGKIEIAEPPWETTLPTVGVSDAEPSPAAEGAPDAAPAVDRDGPASP